MRNRTPKQTHMQLNYISHLHEKISGLNMQFCVELSYAIPLSFPPLYLYRVDKLAVHVTASNVTYINDTLFSNWNLLTS